MWAVKVGFNNVFVVVVICRLQQIFIHRTFVENSVPPTGELLVPSLLCSNPASEVNIPGWFLFVVTGPRAISVNLAHFVLSLSSSDFFPPLQHLSLSLSPLSVYMYPPALSPHFHSYYLTEA